MKKTKYSEIESDEDDFHIPRSKRVVISNRTTRSKVNSNTSSFPTLFESIPNYPPSMLKKWKKSIPIVRPAPPIIPTKPGQFPSFLVLDSIIREVINSTQEKRATKAYMVKYIQKHYKNLIQADDGSGLEQLKNRLDEILSESEFFKQTQFKLYGILQKRKVWIIIDDDYDDDDIDGEAILEEEKEKNYEPPSKKEKQERECSIDSDSSIEVNVVLYQPKPWKALIIEVLSSIPGNRATPDTIVQELIDGYDYFYNKGVLITQPSVKRALEKYCTLGEFNYYHLKPIQTVTLLEQDTMENLVGEEEDQVMKINEELEIEIEAIKTSDETTYFDNLLNTCPTTTITTTITATITESSTNQDHEDFFPLDSPDMESSIRRSTPLQLSDILNNA